MKAVLAMNGGQFSAQARNIKHSVKPVLSTEAAVRDIKRDRTKTDHGAGSQRATAPSDVKFAIWKPSMRLSADPNRLPPT